MSTVVSTRPVSTRVRLARLGESVIAGDPGVGATRGRGRWLTPDGERTIDGVVVAETTAGRVDVELHVVAAWPPRPLVPLAERLRRELTEEAEDAGFGDRLGEIGVSFHDFSTPDETASEGAAR